MGPAIEAMLTMRPAFRSMKYGVIALHVRKTDFVLTVKVQSQSSSVLFVNGMPGGPAAPALLTRIATSAPSRAMASTMPRPIPLPPPVTTATLPSSRMKSPLRSIVGAPEAHMTAHQIGRRNWFGRSDLEGFVHRGSTKRDHSPGRDRRLRRDVAAPHAVR